MARAYDVIGIEKKWQGRWSDEGTYEVDADDPRPPWYVLTMYPYPSGPAHMGHVRNYTFGDLLVRHRTMLGHAVLSPFGFDSFGLPAENAAIKTGTHPRIFTDARIEELKESITSLGAVYDWRREIRSHDPDYIKWNQVIFTKLLEAGLAYRANAPVNWCPGCQTVLANEQVLADGTCERSGDLVVKRDLEQWFFRITRYADELLAGLDELEWPERVKTMQRNWIGRSEGAEFDLVVEGRDGSDGRDPLALRVFTTRPDTSFGMTYAVVAPEHPLVDELTTPEHADDVSRPAGPGRGSTDIERMSESGSASLAKRGAFTGSSVVNPFMGTVVPVYVADYVLMGYGTGAIMAVPAEDTRDWDFAQAYGLPFVRTCGRPTAGTSTAAPTAARRGLHGTRREDQQRLAGRSGHPDGQGPGHRVARGAGHRRPQGELPAARLADLPPALLGLPDPDRLLPDHGIVPVPDDQLPVLAPETSSSCPPASRRWPPIRSSSTPPARLRRPGHPRDRHHGHLRRLVLVLPALYRPRTPDAPFDKDIAGTGCRSTSTSAASSTPSCTCSTPASSPRRWPTSGWPRGLREPFARLFTQGMIRMDGKKMSKSKGNLVAPSSYLTTVGADALRLFHLFVGLRPTTSTGRPRPTR